MGVIGLGFAELVQLVEAKSIKLLLLLLSIFCVIYWPYCIFMKTDEILNRILEKDRLHEEWKRKNKF